MTKSLKIFLIVIASVIVLASAILIPLFATKVTVTLDYMFRLYGIQAIHFDTVQEIKVTRYSTFSPPGYNLRYEYTFGGWFYDTAFTVPFVSGDRITKDITIYAKWIKE